MEKFIKQDKREKEIGFVAKEETVYDFVFSIKMNSD